MYYGSKSKPKSKPKPKPKPKPKSKTITDNQKKKLKEHKKHHTASHMKIMIKEMKAGKTFTQAHNKAMKKVGK